MLWMLVTGDRRRLVVGAYCVAPAGVKGIVGRAGPGEAVPWV